MSEKNQKLDSGANVIKAERQINLGEAILVFIMSIVVIGYPALSKQFPRTCQYRSGKLSDYTG